MHSNTMERHNNKRGFTLIELLVVMAIVGMLLAVIIASIGSEQNKAGDAKRKTEMRQIQYALTIYYNDHGSYPYTGKSFWGISIKGGSHTTSGINAYIPGLVPKYMSVLPVDPKAVRTSWSGYLYRSNGTGYKLLDNNIGPQSFPSAGEAFYDPERVTLAWMVCNGKTACSW